MMRESNRNTKTKQNQKKKGKEKKGEGNTYHYKVPLQETPRVSSWTLGQPCRWTIIEVTLGIFYVPNFSLLKVPDRRI